MFLKRRQFFLYKRSINMQRHLSVVICALYNDIEKNYNFLGIASIFLVLITVEMF